MNILEICNCWNIILGVIHIEMENKYFRKLIEIMKIFKFLLTNPFVKILNILGKKYISLRGVKRKQVRA